MQYNKQFTNRVTRSVLQIQSPHFYARPSQARAVQKKIGFCISWYGPSSLVSKFLMISYIQLKKKYSCLQFPWQLNYHSNEVCGYSLSSYLTSILHINVIQLKKKGLLRYHCGCQGNQATIATGCMASFPLSQRTSIPNMNFIQFKTSYKTLSY